MMSLTTPLTSILLITFQLIDHSIAGIQAPPFVGVTFQTLADYSFGGTPQTQFRRYPTCKTGQLQTPIDISEPFVPVNDGLEFSQQSQIAPPRAAVVNEGHYAQIAPVPETPRSYLKFKGITYTLTDIHFHLGANNAEGSMHTLMGKRFPLEVHVVYRQAKYGFVRDALRHKDGVLIIGVFYQIGSYNDIFDPILASLPRIVNTNQTTLFQPAQPRGSVLGLIPDVKSKFYYYEGALEDPPCEQTVRWIVFDTPMQLGLNQMNSFRGKLKTANGTPQIKSWRFTQPRNGRPIYVNPGFGSNQMSHPSGQMSNPMSQESISEIFDFDYSNSR